MSAFLLSGCGPSGPLPIQSVTSSGNIIQINYDPNQKTNAEMKVLAREHCKRRGLVLRDVTVAKTESATTSLATVFCS